MQNADRRESTIVGCTNVPRKADLMLPLGWGYWFDDKHVFFPNVILKQGLYTGPGSVAACC